MSETLAQAMKTDWVSAEQLSEDYKPVLEMVRELIGVIPNCNPVLEIWPTAFRTFNVLIPNMLNLPAALVGQGAPKDLVGIAMYASSNAAGCPYCTAHHCSFAIRRGADPDAVLGQRDPAEQAVAELAEAMAVVPPTVTPEHIAAVEQHLSPEDVQWVALAVSLGGFLNKVMDSLGIELEDQSIADVQALLRPKGWRPGKHYWKTELLEGLEQEGQTLSSVNPAWAEEDSSESIPIDGFGTYLRVLRQAPGAARLGLRWTRGVSGRTGPALLMLEEHVGYAFPALATVNSPKVVKALATALRDNLDPEQSGVGLEIKLLAGLVYAGEVRSELLNSELMLLMDTLVPEASPVNMAAVQRFAAMPVDRAVMPKGLTSREAAALLLAKAASPSPGKVTEITVAAAMSALSPAEVVELVTWLALLQMLNRFYAFSEARFELDNDGLRVDGRVPDENIHVHGSAFDDGYRAAG